MSTKPQPWLAAVVCCCATAASAAAQEAAADLSTAPPANLAYVEGHVELIIEGVSERADPPMMLLEGDIVRTRNGRAELVFADGSLLHLDFNAELEILDAERIRLLTGRAMLRVSVAAARPYFVDTPAATVRFDSSGEYGIAANQIGADLEVTVARGSAEIDDGSTRATLRSGEMVLLARQGARPLFQPFNSARFDAFAQWSNERTRRFASAQSAAQLPYELRPYGPIFDQYGRWDYVAPYGHVWFPSVGSGWRPYYEGAWNHTPYGWTWYGRDRWAWPTHHYGRWGFTGNFWYWIPANVWGPAWVSWGFAPGYVCWSPLGWDGFPVIGFRSGYPGFGFNPWRGWTVVPRDHFGFRRSVRVNAIDGSRLDPRVRTTLMTQQTTPAPAAVAVARDSVSVPGATGNVRRLDVDGSRRGSVRRPQGGGYPSDGSRAIRAPDAPVAPVARTAPDTPDAPVAPGAGSRRAIRSRDPRSVESARTPPASVRTPPPEATAQPTDGDRGGRTGSVRGAQPRGEPRAESPRSEGQRGGGATREGGGARPRGGSVGAPAQGAPAHSGPPPSGGAVRRRPGN